MGEGKIRGNAVFQVSGCPFEQVGIPVAGSGESLSLRYVFCGGSAGAAVMRSRKY